MTDQKKAPLPVELPRRCKHGLLREYIEYTAEQESPTDFHVWSILSAIATMMGRRCWLDRGQWKLYPNIYVVLVAGSARCRKSTAVNMALDVMRAAYEDINVFSQKITTEKLVHDLYTRYKSEGTSDGLVFSSEFSVFFGKSVNDPTLLQALTDLYDCPEVWQYGTLARGKEIVNKACINMLAATTPEWIRTSLPAESIGGGFTSRIIFVYQDRSGKLNPFPEDAMDVSNRERLTNIVHDLSLIAGVEGQFRWTGEARQAYKEWYTMIYDPDKHMASLGGYYGRKHDTLLKVAMAISMSESDALTIEAKHIDTALELMGQNERYLPTVMDLMELNDNAKVLDKVKSIIRGAPAGRIARSELTQKCQRYCRARELDEILQTLMQAKQVVRASQGSKIFYQYLPQGGM